MSTCSVPTEDALKQVVAVVPPSRSTWFAVAWGGALAVLDQAVVSGTNFLTVVLVGRACGQEELGYYSLGVTILVLLASLQESLVTAPYTVFRERLRGWRRDQYAGRVLVQQAVLALLAAAGLALVAGAFGGVHDEMAWVVAAVVPMVLLRDFCRKLGFVHGRIGGALALDFAIAAIQLSLLAWLASIGQLTASIAFAVVGIVCGTTALACMVLTRSEFALHRRRVGREVGRHWEFGRWVAAGQMVGVAHGYAVHWLLVLMIGPSATGTFAACLAIALLSNPFYLGMGNLLGPWTARARAEGGRVAVRRVVTTAALLLFAVMGLFCLAVALVGSSMMGLLYGDGYAGHGFALTALTAAFAVTSAGMAADHGLRALGRPRVAFTGSLIGLAVTIASGVLLVPHWGIGGAAFGYLLGSTASAAVRLGAFFKLSSIDAIGGRGC